MHCSARTGPMTHRGIAFAAVLLTLGLAGCSSAATRTAGSLTTQATTTTTTTTPSPTPTYASEKEVASVIAGGEKTWREANEKGGECRMALVLQGGRSNRLGPAAHLLHKRGDGRTAGPDRTSGSHCSGHPAVHEDTRR